MGLIFNGLAKVPMQLAILSLGVLVFVFYLFTAPPLWFDPAGRALLSRGGASSSFTALEAGHTRLAAERQSHLRGWLDARRSGHSERQATQAPSLTRAHETAYTLRHV